MAQLPPDPLVPWAIIPLLLLQPQILPPNHSALWASLAGTISLPTIQEGSLGLCGGFLAPLLFLIPPYTCCSLSLAWYNLPHRSRAWAQYLLPLILPAIWECGKALEYLWEILDQRDDELDVGEAEEEL